MTRCVSAKAAVLLSLALLTGADARTGVAPPDDGSAGTDPTMQHDDTAAPEQAEPFVSEEVSFAGGADDVTLAGTLLLPTWAHSEERAPAVVLFTGSGPQDRDETIMNRKPFRVIAEGLARRGYGVLRYDDRGTAAFRFGKSTGDFRNATTADFAADGAEAISWLARRPEIDADRIAVLGHSEGGLVAAQLLADDLVPGAAVLLGGPSVPGSEIIVHQQAVMLRRIRELGIGTLTEEVAERMIQNQRDLVAAVMADDDEAAREVGRRIMRANLQMMPGGAEPSEESVEHKVNFMLAVFQDPWMAAFLRYDPRPDLEKSKVPILALYGGLDLQVDPRQNVVPLLEVIMNIDQPHSRVVVLPRHNHLFQVAETGLFGEYATLPDDLDEEVVGLIADWLDAVLVPPVESEGQDRASELAN